METSKLIIAPPDDLPKRLHQRFRETVSALGPLLIGSASVEAIARLTRLRDEASQMQAIVDAEGLQVKGRDGGMVKHRLLSPLNKARTEIRRLESELALSPAARRRVLGKLLPPPPEAEGEQAFLMRMLLTYDVTDTPPPEDVARLEAIAATKRKSKPVRRPRSRH